MPRLPRILTRPDAVVDVLNRTILGHYLIKPGPTFNSLIVGALAKAREKYPVDIYCGAFLSSHWHLLFKPGTVKNQAGFMREFTRKLSIESGILYDWRGSVFPNRYHAAEVSEEPEAQIRRFIYHLKNGCKEGLCASPLEWPGVPFAEALISGEPLQGIWTDRTGYFQACQRGEDVTLNDFTEHLELPLAPLPCWRHLDQAARRQEILQIIRQIEEDTKIIHEEKGTAPLGPEAVVNHDPHYHPGKLKKSPQPYFHTWRKSVRKEMREALFLIVAAYLEAAERLKAGDRLVIFPENTFPPGLPFVQPGWAMTGPELLNSG